MARAILTKKNAVMAGLLLGTILFSGCEPRLYFSKSSYFDGSVIVEYRQSKAIGTNDYVTLRFYDKGSYEIAFAITPGKVNFSGKVPQNFSKVIKVVPREIVIEQYILPDYLRITIKKNGKCESHDFS